jgi:hypothetical protein
LHSELQACYTGTLPLRQVPTSFCSSYFGDRVPMILLFTLLALAGMTGAHHHAQFFSVEMGYFLPGLAWNHDFPNLSLLCSLGYVIKAPSC